MGKEDKVVNYMVTKNSGAIPKMEQLIFTVTEYVQTNEVSFKFNITFYDGVLLFGIIATKEDHRRLYKALSKQLAKLDCNLKRNE